MQIKEFYSHLNGYEYLQVHLPSLWQEIENVINEVDADCCKTKQSKEKNRLGKMLYCPTTLNKKFKEKLEYLGWHESRTTYYVTKNVDLARSTLNLTHENQKNIIKQHGEEAILSYNQTDFIKNRVAIEVQFGKYSFVAYDLFVKHMAFFVGNEIDIGIEILPMNNLKKQMSSGIAFYEGEVYNVIRQGRSTPAVPLVIIGIDV